MDWTEVTVSVKSKDLDRAGDIASMTVPYGIYIEDYSLLEQEVMEIANIDLIDEELLKKDRNIGLIHIYISPDNTPAEAIAFLSERYKSENIEFSISSSVCVEEDWLNNWKKYFEVLEIGEKLLIRPTWRENCDPKGRTVINLDPGLAFGTGGHETTKLCLCALEKLVKSEDKVLDIGCGSGILAIAALLLGAEHSCGVDIDALAVKTAKENAELNNVQGRAEFLCGNLTDKVSGTFDIITANIVADVLIGMADGIEKFMHESTHLIMSGIIDSRLNDVKAAVADKFEIVEETQEKGWYCLVLKLK